MSRKSRSLSSAPILVWGAHVVQEALDSSHAEIESLYMVNESKSRLSDLFQQARKQNLKVHSETRQSLTQKTEGAEQHQGVAARVRLRTYEDVQEVIDKCSLSLPIWALALDQVTDPRNLGAILRSAHFFGASCVILPRDHSASLTGVVAKASAGALFSLPLVWVSNLAREMERLERLDFWRVGLDASSERTLTQALPEKRSTLLVLGSEGRGLRDLTAKRCDELAKLSISGHRDSLNVSVAAGIACFEVAMKRR